MIGFSRPRKVEVNWHSPTWVKESQSQIFGLEQSEKIYTHDFSIQGNNRHSWERVTTLLYNHLMTFLPFATILNDQGHCRSHTQILHPKFTAQPSHETLIMAQQRTGCINDSTKIPLVTENNNNDDDKNHNSSDTRASYQQQRHLQYQQQPQQQQNQIQFTHPIPLPTTTQKYAHLLQATRLLASRKHQIHERMDTKFSRNVRYERIISDKNALVLPDVPVGTLIRDLAIEFDVSESKMTELREELAWLRIEILRNGIWLEGRQGLPEELWVVVKEWVVSADLEGKEFGRRLEGYRRWGEGTCGDFKKWDLVVLVYGTGWLRIWRYEGRQLDFYFFCMVCKESLRSNQIPIQCTKLWGPTSTRDR